MFLIGKINVLGTYTVADIPPIGSGEYEEVELRRQTPISICNWDFQTMGQPAYMMKYPCRECAVSQSLNASSLFQLPAKSAST